MFTAFTSHSNIYMIYQGGFFKKFCMWMCLPWLQNFNFCYTYFCLHLPRINIPISNYKKHPILFKLGAFYYNLLKIHSVYENWAPSPAMNAAPSSLNQSSRRSTPKTGTYTCTMTMWEPQFYFIRSTWIAAAVLDECMGSLGLVWWLAWYRIGSMVLKWNQINLANCNTIS